MIGKDVIVFLLLWRLHLEVGIFCYVSANADAWVDVTAYQRPHHRSEVSFLCLKLFGWYFLTVRRQILLIR